MPDERPAQAQRRYANRLDVSFSAEEFLLDFGQRFGEEASIVHSGIVATPASVDAFVDVLARSLAEYRRRYGIADGSVEETIARS